MSKEKLGSFKDGSNEPTPEYKIKVARFALETSRQELDEVWERIQSGTIDPERIQELTEILTELTDKLDKKGFLKSPGA